MDMQKILLLFFLFEVGINAQSFPNWFLNKPTNKRCTVGIVQTSFYNDSCYKYAFEKAIEKAAMYYKLKINLKQSFIAAIDKKYWTFFHKKENYDTTLIGYYTDLCTKVDSFQNLKLTFMMISEEKQNFLKANLVNISQVTQPDWTENIPRDNTYYYSVGIAEEYYYLTSSWDAAENSAILELAKSKFIRINSILETESGNFLNTILEFQDEKTETELNNIQILSRWYDIKNKIYYVLARCDKN